MSSPWPLDKLLCANRNAGTVFLALLHLAFGKRQLNTTRASIAKACGLSPRTIGKAVGALHESGWVRRSYGREGRFRRWYRLTLPACEWFPLVRKTVRRERGAVHDSVSRKGLKGTRPYEAKNDTPPKGGAGPATPDWASVPASEVAEDGIAKIERERLAAIRAERRMRPYAADVAPEPDGAVAH